jgi:hypothetical protein
MIKRVLAIAMLTAFTVSAELPYPACTGADCAAPMPPPPPVPSCALRPPYCTV